MKQYNVTIRNVNAEFHALYKKFGAELRRQGVKLEVFGPRILGDMIQKWLDKPDITKYL